MTREEAETILLLYGYDLVFDELKNMTHTAPIKCWQNAYGRIYMYNPDLLNGVVAKIFAFDSAPKHTFFTNFEELINVVEKRGRKQEGA